MVAVSCQSVCQVGSIGATFAKSLLLLVMCCALSMELLWFLFGFHAGNCETSQVSTLIQKKISQNVSATCSRKPIPTKFGRCHPGYSTHSLTRAAAPET